MTLEGFAGAFRRDLSNSGGGAQPDGAIRTKSMLMVSSYGKDYVEACRANVAAQLASYRKVLAAKPWQSRYSSASSSTT
jgi:hypothetical protein